uniref:Elongation factor 2 n=1 Tax=Arcella intermedia TaxID=1963864 RepID=A0A6B2LCD2_9EUKA
MNVSAPLIHYRETVGGASDRVCKTVSGNGRNAVAITAEPLREDLVVDIEKGAVSLSGPQAAQLLSGQYGWDGATAAKLWGFSESNCVVNFTPETDDAVRSAVLGALERLAARGVLCGEPMRGVRFNVVELSVHPQHRSPKHLADCVENALSAAFLCARPTLLEPINLVEIQTEGSVVGNIYAVIAEEQGEVISEGPLRGTPIMKLCAHVPASRCHNITSRLRAATSGRAFPSFGLYHWEAIKDSALSNQIILDVRRRNQLPLHVPLLEQFLK